MLLKYKSPKARKLSSLTEGVSLVLFDPADLRIFAAVELACCVCSGSRREFVGFC